MPQSEHNFVRDADKQLLKSFDEQVKFLDELANDKTAVPRIIQLARDLKAQRDKNKSKLRIHVGSGRKLKF